MAGPAQLPACAECQTVTQWAQGGSSQPAASRMVRSSDGRMRIDSGNTSLITGPKEPQAILLDHGTKEARLIPLPAASPGLAAPQMGGAAPGLLPAAPPPLPAQDLGKGFIDGHEVSGKRYVIPPPPQASPPGQKPQAPPLAQAPTVVEVWTSTKLGMPVLTKVSGPLGQQTCSCKAAQTAEPNPGLFQIPPGYKPAVPPAR